MFPHLCKAPKPWGVGVYLSSPHPTRPRPYSTLWLHIQRWPGQQQPHLKLMPSSK